MLGEEMIDEASAKMALVIAGKGRAAGHAPHVQVRAPAVARRRDTTMQFGRTYEEFEVGAVYQHWPGKTVTEYDDHLFCLLTMNHHPLHLDAHYAAGSTDFGQNVVVGNYIYSLLLGRSVPDASGKAIANLEISSLKHVAPTFHGGTIYGQTTVLGKRPSTSKHDRGHRRGRNRRAQQDRTLACVFRRKVMVRRPRPTSRNTAASSLAAPSPPVNFKDASPSRNTGSRVSRPRRGPRSLGPGRSRIVGQPHHAQRRHRQLGGVFQVVPADRLGRDVSGQGVAAAEVRAVGVEISTQRPGWGKPDAVAVPQHRGEVRHTRDGAPGGHREPEKRQHAVVRVVRVDPAEAGPVEVLLPAGAGSRR